MPAYYPLHLSVAGKKCLVVGGGRTAARKVATLLRCGGRVVVVSPEAVPAIRALARREKIQWRERRFRASDCAGTFLMFAATDSAETNRSIARLAKGKSIPVNVIDNRDACDFIVPSLVERGPLTISIATEGLAPALSRKIRMDLERSFGPEYISYTRLIGEARSVIVKNKQLTGKQKKKALQSLLSLPIRERLARGEKISRRDVLKKLGVI
jgi:precorrin-2 dehydrogenase / sirohydrochlorin ferrochelatase